MVKRLSNTDQNSNKLTNIPTPVGTSDAVNKAYADTKQSINTNITDAIQEWWIYPVATYVEAEDRTVFGGYSTTGKILVCEYNHATTELKRVEAATTAVIDDHNNPAVWVQAGRRILIAYTNHNKDNIMRFKVSDSAGTIESLASASEQTYNAGMGVTYAQIHKIESQSDSTKDVFWVFSRWTTHKWYILPVTVAQSSGTIAFGTPVELVSTSVTSHTQLYLSTAPSYGANQRIRVSWYHNPAGDIQAIRYFDINAETGAVMSRVDNTNLGNVIGNAGLPVLASEVTPIVPEPANSSISRRMFYTRPGPAAPAIAYAEWDISDPDNAVYTLAEASDETASDWTTSTYGTAGTRVGYTDTANYIAGMSFPEPAYDRGFILAREKDGRSTVELYAKTDTVTTSKVIASSMSNMFVRPIIPINAGEITAVYSSVSEYVGFDNYTSTVNLSKERIGTSIATISASGSSAAAGTLNISSSGNVAVTGLGFRPSLVKFYGVLNNTSVSNAWAHGHYSSASQVAMSGATRGSNSWSRTYTTQCLALVTLDASGGTIAQVSISGVSLDTNGFTVNNAISSTNSTVSWEAYP